MLTTLVLDWRDKVNSIDRRVAFEIRSTVSSFDTLSWLSDRWKSVRNLKSCNRLFTSQFECSMISRLDPLRFSMRPLLQKICALVWCRRHLQEGVSTFFILLLDFRKKKESSDNFFLKKCLFVSKQMTNYCLVIAAWLLVNPWLCDAKSFLFVSKLDKEWWLSAKCNMRLSRWSWWSLPIA